MATATTRLDQALVDRGLVETRSRAQALIMAGCVFVDDRKETKPGTKVKPGAALLVKGADHPWVSRGGLKLQGAIDQFGLDPTAAVAIDVGASTGGFTDVLLTRGAARVYAVDVGHGQLAWKLRQDERVVVLEKLNARYLTEKHVPEPVDWVVCDASFIGLRTVLPAALSRLKPGGLAVGLIKPQFEVGKGRVGKGGIVREPELHAEVVETISGWFASLPGVEVTGVTQSPIKGPDGNVEFLIVACFTAGGAGLFTPRDPGEADGDAAGD